MNDNKIGNDECNELLNLNEEYKNNKKSKLNVFPTKVNNTIFIYYII